MKCQRCGSERVLSASCKCSDRFNATLGTVQFDGYVPDDLGVGGGDYVEFGVCLDCGQLQGNFPLPVSEMEKDCSDKELFDFFDENFSMGEFFQNIYASRRARIIKDAEHISYKLRSYFIDLFDSHCDITSETQVPSISKFLDAYKKGSFEL